MKMKLILILTVLLLAIGARAQTVNAKYTFSNYVTQPAAVSLITLTPQQPDYNYTGAILAPIPMARVTDASGSYTYSNIVVGYSYILDLKVGLNDYYFTNNYQVGLTNTAAGYVNSALYVGFWSGQIFAYFSATNWLFSTNTTFSYVTNTFNVTNTITVNITNNLTGTNLTVQATNGAGAYLVGTAVIVSTNYDALGAATAAGAIERAALNLTNSALQTAIIASNQAALYAATNTSASERTAMILTNTGTLTALNIASNYLGTNWLAQLVGTNAALTAYFNGLISSANANTATASNFLANTKQPASLTLSNLANVGALTNWIQGGTNITLVTNVLGQISFNTPTQTQLTNGITLAAAQNATNLFSTATNLSTVQSAAVTAALNASNAVIASTYYPLSNPAGYVTSATTNGLATTNYVQQSLIASNYTTVPVATTIADTEAATTIANAGLTTNGPVLFNTALQGTTSLYGNLFVPGFTSISVPHGTVSAQFISGDGTSMFNIPFTGVNGLGTAAASNASEFVLSGDARVINALTNLAALTALSNQIAYAQSQDGNDTNLLVATGANAAAVNGTNIWSGSAWTNMNGSAWYSNSAWYVSGIAAYGSAYPTGPTTNINGFSPQPTVYFLPKTNIAGANMTLTYAFGVTTFASTGGGGGTNSGSTNFVLTGFVTGFTTSNLLSTAGSNTVAAIAIANSTSPTNGISSVQASNFAFNVSSAVVNSNLNGFIPSNAIAANMAAFVPTNLFLQAGPLGVTDGSLLNGTPSTTISNGLGITSAAFRQPNGETNYAMNLNTNISATIGAQILATNTSSWFTQQVLSIVPPSGAASNAIANNLGVGTNVTLYGVTALDGGLLDVYHSGSPGTNYTIVVSGGTMNENGVYYYGFTTGITAGQITYTNLIGNYGICWNGTTNWALASNTLSGWSLHRYTTNAPFAPMSGSVYSTTGSTNWGAYPTFQFLLNQAAAENIATTNQLVVYGNGIDFETTNLTMNGLPFVNGAASSGTGSSFNFLSTTNLVVTGLTGLATNFNGTYVDTGANYYSNSFTHWLLVKSSFTYLGGFQFPFNILTTNLSLVSPFGNSINGTPAYYSYFLTGPYSLLPSTTYDSYYNPTNGHAVVSYDSSTFSNQVLAIDGAGGKTYAAGNGILFTGGGLTNINVDPSIVPTNGGSFSGNQFSNSGTSYLGGVVTATNMNNYIMVAASNVFGGGTLPTGILTGGNTNTPGHLLAVVGNTRMVTYDAESLTNAPATNLNWSGFTLATSNLPPSVVRGSQRIFFVATNGNNNTAVINSISNPFAPNFLWWTGVCALATNPGDIIWLQPGNYYATTNGIAIAPQVTFKGTSPDTTIIWETNGNSAWSTFQPLGDNVRIRDLTWISFPTNSFTRFGSFIESQGANNPIQVPVGWNHITNWTGCIVDNCFIRAGLDVFYSDDSGDYRGLTVQNSDLRSEWDFFSSSAIGYLNSINNKWYGTDKSGVSNFKLSVNTPFTDVGSRFVGFPAHTNLTNIRGLFSYAQTPTPVSLNGSQFFITNMPPLFDTNNAMASGSYVDMVTFRSYTLDAGRSSFFTNSTTTNTTYNQSYSTLYLSGGTQAGATNNQYNVQTNPPDVLLGVGSWTNTIDGRYSIKFNGTNNYGNASSIISYFSNNVDMWDITSQIPINSYQVNAAGILFDTQVSGSGSAPSLFYITNSTSMAIVPNYSPQAFNMGLVGTASGGLSNVVSLNFFGNGSGLSNVVALAVTGTLTNSITGSAASVAAAGVTGPTWVNTNNGTSWNQTIIGSPVATITNIIGGTTGLDPNAPTLTGNTNGGYVTIMGHDNSSTVEIVGGATNRNGNAYLLLGGKSSSATGIIELGMLSTANFKIYKVTTGGSFTLLETLDAATGNMTLGTGGYTGSAVSTLSTNWLVFSSVSALTNTLGRNCTALVTAGTSVSLQDTNGNSIATIGTIATLDVPIPLNVNMRLSGTAVSAILY